MPFRAAPTARATSSNRARALFVEIDNTDAEGRLILADALTRAGEDKPELIVDFATLTGAARVALGPDLPAFFANQDELAAAAEQAAREVEDPLWRMPLWEPYDEMLKSDVADFANAANTPDGRLHHRGDVPQALRSRRDRLGASRHLRVARHARPGRPKGGEALGLRAIFAAAAGPLLAATETPIGRESGTF